MAVTVGDVLHAPELDLRLAAGPAAALAREVRWVAVTELADPGRFLAGGELVLTTGLRQTDPAAQRAFVEQVAAAGAAALGFGTALTHRTIPPATLAAARRRGLPVLDVPYDTPFPAIDRYVADRVLAAQYGRARRLLLAYDALATAVVSDRGLEGMLGVLHHEIGAPVSVIGTVGQVLATVPARSPWPAGRVPTWADGHRGPDGEAEVVALAVDLAGITEAYLVARRPRVLTDLLPYAVGLVGLELARRRAVVEGRRELLAQVLADVVRGSLSDAVAAGRLAPFDIDVAAANSVVVGRVPGRPDEAVRRAAAAPLAHPATVTAWVGGTLVAVVRGGRAPEVPDALAEHLARTGGAPAVGVGGAYPGVAGLRWSYHEAMQAVSRGPGRHERAGLSMAGLLAATADVPIKELAADVLAPLRAHDAATGGALVATLAAYLDEDCSVGATAARLYLHRNTVRYRLAQVEQLAGRGVDSTADRMHWYLALLASPPG